jgi:hypothetical protein
MQKVEVGIVIGEAADVAGKKSLRAATGKVKEECC